MTENNDTPAAPPVQAEADAVSFEIATIERGMQSDFGAYTRDGALQKRYGELLEVQEAGAGVPAAPSPIQAEITALEREMADTRGPYWSGPDAAAKQARYRQLIEAEDESPAGDAVQVAGLSAADASISHATAMAIERDLGDTANEVNDALAANLSDAARNAVAREFGQAQPTASPATPADVDRFTATGPGKILMAEWGGDAARRLGVVLARWGRLTDDLSDADFNALDDLYRNRLQPAEGAAVLRQLAR